MGGANLDVDPVQVLVYYDPHPLPRDVTHGSPLRSSSLTGSERLALTFPTHGIDNTPGTHVQFSSTSLDGTRLTLHWHSYGPIAPLHEVIGGTPDPDVGYAERYGQHFRRGLVVRFPPGSGETVMAHWNSHRSVPVTGERAGGPSKPQTVGLFDITNEENGRRCSHSTTIPASGGFVPLGRRRRSWQRRLDS